MANTILASTTPHNFTLSYLLTTTVSPFAFNSSIDHAIIFEAYTTAPTTATNYYTQAQVGTVVMAQLPDGTSLPMSGENVPLDPKQSAIYSNGWTRYVGNMTIPSGTPEGRYSYKACALDAASSGNCDSPGGVLLSQVKSNYFLVDNTPPALATPLPLPDHNTLNRQPLISVAAADTLSGIDQSSATIDLDGTRLASGVTSFTPTTPLSFGVHSVTVNVADLAGNVSAESWQFNITTLSASSTSGRLEEQTVKVNPTADLLSAPTTVTFKNVKVNVDPYQLSFGSSPYLGYGTFSRSVDLSGASVTFNNETGIPSGPVSAQITSQTLSAEAALPFQVSGSTVARIPSLTKTIASVTVTVPTGYNTSGSTATIGMPAVTASEVSTTSDDPLPNAISGGDPLLVGISSQTMVRVDESNGEVVGVSGLEGTIYAYTLINSQRKEIFKPINVGDPPDEPYKEDPQVKCNGAVDINWTCIYQSRAVVFNRAYSFELRAAGIAAYGNHWIFRDKSIPTYLAWNQVRTVVDQSTPCINHVRTQAEILEATTATRQVVVDPITRRSAWRITGSAYSDAGIADPNNPGMLKSDPELGWATNGLTKTALYSPNASPSKVAEQNDAPGPVSTSFTLKPQQNQHLFVPQQMVLGAKYEIDPDATVRNALEIVAANNWQFWVNYVSC